MKKIIILFISLPFYLISCGDEGSKENTTKGKSCSTGEGTVMDPNDVKPMALMMRQLANNCDSMRLKINRDVVVDSTEYGLPPFWTAEPTDSSVLEDLFYHNAESFAKAYRTLMSDKTNQQANYTAVINQCINCHSSYCAGPLRRINKLKLDFKE